MGDTNAGLEERLAEQRAREEELSATRGEGGSRSSIQAQSIATLSRKGSYR